MASADRFFGVRLLALATPPFRPNSTAALLLLSLVWRSLERLRLRSVCNCSRTSRLTFWLVRRACWTSFVVASEFVLSRVELV